MCTRAGSCRGLPCQPSVEAGNSQVDAVCWPTLHVGLGLIGDTYTLTRACIGQACHPGSPNGHRHAAPQALASAYRLCFKRHDDVTVPYAAAAAVANRGRGLPMAWLAAACALPRVARKSQCFNLLLPHIAQKASYTASTDSAPAESPGRPHDAFGEVIKPSDLPLRELLTGEVIGDRELLRRHQTEDGKHLLEANVARLLEASERSRPGERWDTVPVP